MPGVPPPVVLVVDDEEMHRTLVKRILEHDGYEVIACRSGAEALDEIARTEVDLVICDFFMPGMHGDVVLSRIRGNPRTSRLPVLMLTAIKEPEEQVRVLDQGADDFVTKPFETKVLQARVRSLVRMKRLNDEMENFDNVLASMASAMEAKDAYTQGHSERVSMIGALLAGSMGLDDSTQEVLRSAGLVHDIGKLVVDLSFINKPGKLTAEEWAVMKSHPEAGARILAPLRKARSLLPLIRHHHERLNGRGYPDCLVEDQIPVPVRVISVADVYDALTTNRSYRDAMSHDKAMEILWREAGDGSWDRDVVGALSGIDPGLLHVSR